MSLQLTLVNLWLRFLVKPMMTRNTDPVKRREIMDRAGRHMTGGVTQREGALSKDLPALWLHPEGAQDKRVILHLHGGGFVTGSPESHRAMLSWLARATGIEVCLPAYRLAPEHPFPAAPDDALAAWEALRARGYAPEDIVVTGDSAGGNLALVLLGDLMAKGERPCAVAAMSPATDLSFTSPSVTENIARDVLLPLSRLEDIKRLYLVDASADDPRASPLAARFDNPPPVFLQFSDVEALRDDSPRMAAVLRDAGGEVVEDMCPGTPHVVAFFAGFVPEARRAIDRIAAFITKAYADQGT